MPEIETENDCLVGIQGDQVLVMLPPLRGMDRDKALRLAAWIVAVTCIGDEQDAEFAAVLAAVRNT